MSRPYSLIGKRNRLAATALAGAIAIFLPAVVAHAETTSPAHSGIEVAQASAKGASEAQPAVGWKTPSKAAHIPVAFG